MVSTGIPALDSLLVDGFPDRSAILVTGPPGIGKEAICYWFLSSAVQQGDIAMYVSRRSVAEVFEDARGYGAALEGSVTFLDCSGIPAAADAIPCSLSDPTEISVAIKRLVAEHGRRRIRIVLDILSPLLLLNPLETMYRFFNALFVELKKHDSVTVATLEAGMHGTREMVAFEQVFDGVVEMQLYEEGGPGCEVPLLRVKKMRGLPPRPAFFHVRFSPGTRMELHPFTAAEETLRLAAKQ